MGEKVGYNESGVAVILTEADFNCFAVFLADNAVKRKGNCCPLIFLDSAVIMCFEQSKL